MKTVSYSQSYFERTRSTCYTNPNWLGCNQTTIFPNRIRMKETYPANELNRLLTANQHNTFIPVGKLGDILIQRTNPIFRMRFCEIFLESIRELDENEIIITDRFLIPISIEIGKQIKFPSEYHSKYFTYGSLRRINPDQYIGLNNAECRKYIESCDSSIQAHLKSFNSAYQITTYKNKWL